MEFNEEYTATVMRRIFDCKLEQIDLVSGIDKRRIPIHRVVLMATSEYFAGILRTIDPSDTSNEFVLDSSGEAIKTVVEYCYTGHIVLTERNLEDCLKIAVDGGMDLLLNECFDYFPEKLSTKNVVDVLLAADKFNLIELKQSATELLWSHLECETTTHINQFNPATMFRLMEIVVDTIPNDLLVDRLRSWFHHDKAERGDHMPKMLRLVRLEHLTSEFLRETIKPLFEQFECVELLNDEFRRRGMYHTQSTSSSSAKDGSTTTNDKMTLFCVMYSLSNSAFTVHRYDESLNKFMPQFTSQWTELEWYRTILYENKIFKTGGASSTIAYDLRRGRREEENLLPMNECRYYHTSILMEKSIYAFGGGAESSCERYDIEKGTWHIIKPMNHNRTNASAAILDGLIYVVGGADWGQMSNLVESYDPKTDEWTDRMELDRRELQPTLVAFNGMLYAFLDYNGVREYDPAKNVWTKFQTNHNFRSAIAINGSLFAITEDGSYGQVTIDEHERKVDFAEHTVVKVSDLHSISLQQCRFDA